MVGIGRLAYLLGKVGGDLEAPGVNFRRWRIGADDLKRGGEAADRAVRTGQWNWRLEVKMGEPVERP